MPGDKINSTWADKDNQYAFNNENGDWYMITEKKPLKENYKIVTGAYIVQRYLCDDLWVKAVSLSDTNFSATCFCAGERF